MLSRFIFFLAHRRCTGREERGASGSGDFLREWFSLGKDDYLSCECQAGTETNLQGELAGEFRVLLEQAGSPAR